MLTEQKQGGRIDGLRLDGGERLHTRYMSGVYLVVTEQGQLLYVGRSVNIWARIHNHTHPLIRYQSRKIICFEIEDEVDRNACETLLIRHLRPPWNKRSKIIKPMLQSEADLLVKYGFKVLAARPSPNQPRFSPDPFSLVRGVVDKPFRRSWRGDRPLELPDEVGSVQERWRWNRQVEDEELAA